MVKGLVGNFCCCIYWWLWNMVGFVDVVLCFGIKNVIIKRWGFYNLGCFGFFMRDYVVWEYKYSFVEFGEVVGDKEW